MLTGQYERTIYLSFLIFLKKMKKSVAVGSNLNVTH